MDQNTGILCFLRDFFQNLKNKFGLNFEISSFRIPLLFPLLLLQDRSITCKVIEMSQLFSANGLVSKICVTK